MNYAENTSAIDALEKGFDDMIDLCDVVAEKFTEERGRFDSKTV